MSWKARLSTAINELRVIYCAKSSSSIGTREFVRKYYPDLKTLNPGLPIYVRPADGIEPSISVRYDRGVYDTRSTSGLGAEDVLKVVKECADAAPQVNENLAVQFGTSSSRSIPEVV